MNRFLLIALVLLVVPAWLAGLPADAQTKPSMKGGNIRRNYDWSAFIHAAPAKNYLSYAGSTLHPLTKVSVTLRQATGATAMYEEFWYQRGKVLGVHRKKNTFQQADRDQMGAIVIGGEIDDDPSAVESCVNALARLLIDFQLKHLVTEDVVVPQDSFQTVLGEMRNYGFITRDTIPLDGPQFSIVLRSDPFVDEARLYLAK
jgi:hypothetical protein